MSKLHLIIDGTDKVGKTTVCDILKVQLNLPLIKMKDMNVHFHVNPEVASEIFNKTIVQFKDYPFICDRGYPTSIVYSSKYERTHSLEYIEMVKKELNPVIVILVSYKQRGEDEMIAEKDRLELQDIFQQKAEFYGWNVIDTTDLTPQEVCNQILEICHSK